MNSLHLNSLQKRDTSTSQVRDKHLSHSYLFMYMRPLEIQTQSNGFGLHQHYSHIQFTNTMDITNFKTAPLVREYLLSENTRNGSNYELEDKLELILQNKEKGIALSATQLEEDFQFQRFFTWDVNHRYEININLSGRFSSEHTMNVDKDLYDELEEGDTDYDNSDILVDSYALDDARDGLDIEDAEVLSKYESINVSNLKIKEEFKNITPDADSLIEGGAA